ncbi:hypothetical protein [Zhenhengia yiwuensis]|uniref:Uncharacterized protein n=1 Tax=Zhenhengia yiwuensis TaxID=2763666 RepID=A0A926EG57_9FIRM|nr:hypothetical protein [Zhenhengia yiwuensis]MBC8578956.1 hypothetical protein [Zhenhengia yiwuensis]
MKRLSISIIPFVLAIGPILDPYILSSFGSTEIRLMDIFVICCAGLILLKERKVKVNFALLYMTIGIFIINLMSFLMYSPNRDFLVTLKVIAVWIVYILLLSILWQTYDKQKFINYTMKIAIIASVFLIVQFICLNLGFGQIWNGRIPFLELSKYDNWSKMIDVTGVIRVHSFFQEPSYVAIYLLPVIAYCFKRGKYFYSCIMILAVLLSTSSVGVMGLMLVIAYYIVTLPKQHIPVRRKKSFMMYIIFSILLLIIIYFYSEDIREIINYSIEKVSLIFKDLKDERMGSAKIRILGNINHFYKYPLWYKFFGVGINQYPSYLGGVIPYSSTVVTFILNYGIIGLIVLVSYFFINLKKLSGYNKIFCLIFVMYCSVDLFWFHWYFFYTLTWMNSFEHKKEKNNIEEIKLT